MESLERLARTKFTDPPLSAAEERVMRAAPDGTIAECRDLGGSVDPEKANGAPEEKWPDARSIRAGLIRWLCVDREAREQVDPLGVWIQGARLAGRLDLSFACIPFPLLILGCRLEQDLNLRYAKMPVLSLSGSWTGAIGADGLRLDGSLFLRRGFHAEGEVRLPNATIGGDLDAAGGTFNNAKGCALNAHRIKVKGSVLMKQEVNAKGEIQGAFNAAGEVRLLGATIEGDIDAEGGTFINVNGMALIADRIEVHDNVFLTKSFHAEGEVRLPGAEITGQLDVEDAWLGELNLESAHIAGTFFWRNIHKDSDPRFPNKEWKPYLNLTNANVGLLVDQEASWPEKGRLRLDGFVYDHIAAGLTAAKVPTDARPPIDATARLRWLRLQPDEFGYLPQPYEQLIAVLRRMGHEHQVANVAIAKQMDLYEHGDLGRWGKFRSWVLYHAVRYGYEPWRAFMWMAIVVIVGTLMFSVARLPSIRLMVPSDKDAYQSDENSQKVPLPHYYPQFHGFVYSLDVILPFDLGQKAHWRLHERWPCDYLYWVLEGYSLIQLFMGWVLLLIAAAVPAGLIKED